MKFWGEHKHVEMFTVHYNKIVSNTFKKFQVTMAVEKTILFLIWDTQDWMLTQKIKERSGASGLESYKVMNSFQVSTNLG